jgi:hypothetical protein
MFVETRFSYSGYFTYAGNAFPGARMPRGAPSLQNPVPPMLPQRQSVLIHTAFTFK